MKLIKQLTFADKNDDCPSICDGIKFNSAEVIDMRKLFLTALLVAMVSASTTFAAAVDSGFGTANSQSFVNL